MIECFVQIYDKQFRAKALSIIYSCTSMLGVMSGVYKAETSALLLLLPMLKPWMDQFSSILNLSVQPEELYSQPQPKSYTDMRHLEELYNKYKDPYADMIKADGISLLCSDLQVDPQDIVMVGYTPDYLFLLQAILRSDQITVVVLV